MVSHMAVLYIALLFIAIWLELDLRVNTDSILEKIGLGFIAVGCAVSLHSPNNLITYGAFLYFAAVGIKVFIRKRRASDGKAKSHLL
jgi:dipeptide/tripeptide permease